MAYGKQAEPPRQQAINAHKKFQGPIPPTVPRVGKRTTPAKSYVAPGSYNSPSAFGRQGSSVKSSSATHSFGTASRIQQEKVFASNSFSARDPNHISEKSTAYLSASMMGKQPDSKKRTAPTCRFGTASRFGPTKAMITKQHADAVQQGQESPGPVYKHKDHFGRLKSSVGKQGPTSKFGTGRRKDMNSEPGSSGATSTYFGTPGPGTYASAVASVGKQVASRASTAPTFKFGSSDREKQSKLYLPGADTEMQGKNSPGPSAYYPKLNVGDNAPTQTRAGAFSFGGDAMYDEVAKQTPRNNPGPGEHEHPSALATQVSSTRPTLPQYRFGKDSRLPKSPRANREYPGCNSYYLQESTGQQIETQRQNAPVYSMGTCTRQTASKVYNGL